MRERTLVVVKPDALKRVGEEPELLTRILLYFLNEDLELVDGKYIERTTKAQLDKHFPDSDEWIIAMGERACKRVREERGEDPVERFGTDVPKDVGRIIIKGCREYYMSGPLLVYVMEGEDAVRKARKVLGSALPSRAPKGTIRGDLGIPEDPNSIAATKNLVHASDSPEDAEREIAAWFSSDTPP